MRTIAEFVKDGDKEGKPEGNYILVELLAAQVVAKAAYDGTQFKSLDEIKRAVFEVAGYPMLNRLSGPSTRPQSDVGTEAAYRVAQLVGLNVE
jgi:hypothetical protein